MSAKAFVLFEAMAVFAIFCNLSPEVIGLPHSSDFLSKMAPIGLPLSFQNVTNKNATVGGVGLIPWRCFVRINDTMCSCSILNGNYVLARAACMKKTTTTTKFQIHAGASHADNADQIVAAVVLSTAEPPPEGIMVLKLNEQLKFNNHVGSVKLFEKKFDGYNFGYVSGFRYEKGVYQHESYGAGILENKCTKDRLCAYGAYWPEFTPNEDDSKATDFLDYYDEDTYQFELVGVLDRHYEPTDATYYKVRDMIPWMTKYVPGLE